MAKKKRVVPLKQRKYRSTDEEQRILIAAAARAKTTVSPFIRTWIKTLQDERKEA